MGQFFSDPVEQALQYIYYDLQVRRGQDGFHLLQQAAEAGDADACCLLGRCLYGWQYIWPGHNFPIDHETGDELMRRSVLEGSAIGTLLSLRNGMMDEELTQDMPLTLQEAFDIVLDKAERGEPLCQMIIGNVYFWGDFITIEGRLWEDFERDDDVECFLRENYSKCEDWLWKAYRNGLSLVNPNLSNFYNEGKKGLIPPRPEKELEVDHYGVERGYPDCIFYYASTLYDSGETVKAYELYRKAADLGEPRAYFRTGFSYEVGKGVPKDAARAAQYYQQALAAPIPVKANAANRLGMLLYDGKGVERDYDRAFQLIKWAEENGNVPQLYYLGACYANGHGTQQDYTKAVQYLERIDWNCAPAFYLLGKLYCNGLGVPKNIAKGVEYLEKAGEYAPAQEERKHYKKNLFGRWVRR